MRHVSVGTTPFIECAACDGVWIDADVFERLCVEQESRAAVLHQLKERTGAVSSTAVRYRQCVRCGKMMNRVNFGRLSGAVVDVCRGHGTFLDAGELHQIAAFIQAGGLERARQRTIDDLREEERRLRDIEARQARSTGNPHGDTASRTWTASEVMDLLDRLGR